MPFCTACGKQNPDDARFCSQCGTRLASAHRGRRSRRRPGETTATITIGGAATRSRPPTASSTPSTRPRWTRCPPGTRCSSCSADPAPGAGSCSTRTSSTPVATPTARSSSTTSRSRAGTRSSTATATTGSRSPTWAASTAPTSTATASTGSTLKDGDEVQIGKYRLVFFDPGTRAPERAYRRDGPGRVLGGRPGGAHEHRGGARPPAPRLPGDHHPQDPVPRGQGPDQARAHARRLPQVLSRRRRPAALRAAHAARPLPAPQGDRRAPRRHRPRPRAAADRRRGADRRPRSPWPPTGSRARSRSHAATTCGSRAAS